VSSTPSPASGTRPSESQPLPPAIVSHVRDLHARHARGSSNTCGRTGWSSRDRCWGARRRTRRRLSEARTQCSCRRKLSQRRKPPRAEVLAQVRGMVRVRCPLLRETDDEEQASSRRRRRLEIHGYDPRAHDGAREMSAVHLPELCDRAADSRRYKLVPLGDLSPAERSRRNPAGIK